VLEAGRDRLVRISRQGRIAIRAINHSFFHFSSPRDDFGIFHSGIAILYGLAPQIKQKSGRPPRKGAPTLLPSLGVRRKLSLPMGDTRSPAWPARKVQKRVPLSLSKALIWSVPLTAPLLVLSGAKLDGENVKYSARSWSFQRSVKLKYLESWTSQWKSSEGAVHSCRRYRKYRRSPGCCNS